jgi:hypothetical protein
MGLRLYHRVRKSGLGLPVNATKTRVGKCVQGPRRDYKLRLLALVVAVYASDKDGGNVFPSVRTLAADTGLHRSQVVAALRQLRDLGVLRVERARGRRTTRYAFVAAALPPWPPDASGAVTATSIGIGLDVEVFSPPGAQEPRTK